ncbi:autotransporter outer membrane beta-barrel domain-containing protein, partial [Brucella intermedia]|uniref:autotransporter outer membrane beta-barrel domain-containing protein n=1 Tax=Brucella intermedia TaxID=94625 RepID=UPI00235F1574
GQRVAIDQQWSVTPQAQLSWSSLDLDGFADAFGAHVRSDRDNSLTGRVGLGVNYETSWQDAEGYTTRLDVGGIANVYRELLDDARHIDVSGVKIATGKNDRTWGELGLTTTYTWHDGQYGVFGKVSTATGLEKFGDSYNVSGNVGFRVKW